MQTMAMLGASGHPVMVTGSEALQSGEIIPRIACGYYHSLALKKDGTVFSFGRNDYGQLGLGNNEGSRVPKQIDALSPKKKIGTRQWNRFF